MKKKILIALCLFACLFGMTGCADIMNSIPPSAEEVEKFLADWTLTRNYVTGTSGSAEIARKEVFEDGTVWEYSSVDGLETRTFHYMYQGKTHIIKIEGNNVYVDGKPNTDEQKPIIKSLEDWEAKSLEPISYSYANTRKTSGFKFTVKDVYTEDGRATTSIVCEGNRKYSFEVSGDQVGGQGDVQFSPDTVGINGKLLNDDQCKKWNSDIWSILEALWKVV